MATPTDRDVTRALVALANQTPGQTLDDLQAQLIREALVARGLLS